LRLGPALADFTTRRPFVSAGAGLALVAALNLLDWVLFRVAFDLSYFRWYLDNGTLLTLALALVTVAWPDLNELRNLVSPHPLRYLQAWSGLFGFTFLSMPDADIPLHELHGSPDRSASSAVWTLLDIADTVLRLTWLPVFLGAVLFWLLVIAPVQYFIFLLTGALARGASQSSKKLIVKASDQESNIDFTIEDLPASEDPPAGWSESGFFARPVTITVVLTGALLFALSYLVS
jgi:hypothetical protein